MQIKSGDTVRHLDSGAIGVVTSVVGECAYIRTARGMLICFLHTLTEV
jgi:hypothetical protein